jgi:aspartyl-tRNA(Asn)/glutamyl-tRNA(Gln) amidotransferase subunit A
LSWTLDSVGVLTRSVQDAALVFQALQGPDPEDEATFNVSPTDVFTRLNRGVEGLKLAFAETVFFDEVDAEIEKAVRASGEVFQSLGAGVESMEVPEAAEAHEARKRALMIAAEACVINEKLLREHYAELDPIAAERMKAGQTLSAPEYLSLLRRWRALQRSCQETLKDVDALLVPTTMIPAGRLTEVDAGLETYFKYNARYLRNTSLGNILNWCAVSVPCGFTREGLPIGLMVYAKPFQEDAALRAAHAYEQATDWHNRHPDLSWIG